MSYLNHVKDIVAETLTFQVLENPAWYTPYTPYQPEIAQGTSDMVCVNLKLNIRIQVAWNLCLISRPWSCH